MKRILLALVGILPLICSCSPVESNDSGVPKNLIGTWEAIKSESYSDWKKIYEDTFRAEEYQIVFDEYTYLEIEDGEIEWRSAYTYDKKKKRIVPAFGKVMVVDKLTASELVLIFGDIGGDIGYEQGEFAKGTFIK